MRVLELFSGTGSVGKVCKEKNWKVLSLDLKNADINCDIMNWNYKEFDRDAFDIIWSSPPCTSYSALLASWIGRNVRGEFYTKEIMERDMLEGDKIVKKTLEIINYFNTKYWFMENPQTGRLKSRDFMKDIPYYDVSYCHYSDWGYRKHTRIWTNRTDFIPKWCNRDCDNMITPNKHRVDLQNLNIELKYRIPPNLIRDLLNVEVNDSDVDKN